MAETLHLVCPHCTSVNRIPAERLAASPRCGQCHQPLFTAHPIELTDAAARQSGALSKSDIVRWVRAQI